jgi:hypothetical protein
MVVAVNRTKSEARWVAVFSNGVEVSRPIRHQYSHAWYAEESGQGRNMTGFAASEDRAHTAAEAWGRAFRSGSVSVEVVIVRAVGIRQE